MAKYSTGEVSAARASMHRFAIFCMAGVRTIIFDDRDGLVRLLELSFAISKFAATVGIAWGVAETAGPKRNSPPVWQGRT